VNLFSHMAFVRTGIRVKLHLHSMGGCIHLLEGFGWVVIEYIIPYMDFSTITIRCTII
jgi:hypothetical protein